MGGARATAPASATLLGKQRAALGCLMEAGSFIEQQAVTCVYLN